MFMLGRGEWTHKILHAFLGLVLCLVFIPSPASAENHVAVLLSDTEKAYSAPLDSFTKEVGAPVKIYNLEGDIHKAPEMMAEILSQKPALIFVLGAKAAYVAKIWTSDLPEIPVIFSMVLNWQKYELFPGQENIAGIANEVAPGVQFANTAIIAPATRRIGVIYSKEHSAHVIKEAKESAEKLGIDLIAKSISRPHDFRHAFQRMADRIDGYWIVADPVVYTLENISWLEKKCMKQNLICIGQSRNVATGGILLAVDIDVTNIGSQAASMAKNILIRHQSPKNIGVMPPLGTRLLLNMKTARKIGLSVSQVAMDLANEIIDK